MLFRSQHLAATQERGIGFVWDTPVRSPLRTHVQQKMGLSAVLNAPKCGSGLHRPTHLWQNLLPKEKLDEAYSNLTQVKPMRISLTSGEGDLRVPTFKRSLVVEDWPSSTQGGGVVLVLKRVSSVGGLVAEDVVSPRGSSHELSPARSSISLTACGGSLRFE